jgi:hypothetical protein
MFEADIVITEVDKPFNNWCASGHHPSDFFKRSGPNSQPEKTRFFQFNGKNINAIYCEPCLVIAQFLAKKSKDNK